MQNNYQKKNFQAFKIQGNCRGFGQRLTAFLKPKRVGILAFLCLFSTILCKAQGTITGFNLINANSNQAIQPLVSGAVLNLATLPTNKLNIQAVTNPSIVGSVGFNLTGAQTKTRSDESGPNYSLQGDSNGDYNSWTPPVGNYTLTARTFTGKNGSGTPGALVTITFSVINQATPPQYTLTVNISGFGSVNRNPSLATYTSGSTVTLTATPDPGYQFNGWSGSATGTTNPLNIIMNGNKTITATFIPIPVQYSLTVPITGNGTVSKNPDQATYSNGSNVTLTATPAAGYVFDSWSGDVTSTANPLVVNMNSNKNITANFTLSATLYNLNITVVGNGTVSKNPDMASYPINTVVTLTANPTGGSSFGSWSGDASGNTNPLTITMNGDKTITATFMSFSPTGYCGPNNSDNIGCFTSVRPVGQTQVITYPTQTHRFQLIAKQGVTTYTDGTSGTFPSSFDFTGYVPINGSSTEGYLSLSHEKTPGLVSVMNLTLNANTLLWNVGTTRRINFGPVVKIERPCAGTVTPWGTVIISEETESGGDSNGDGYQDVGWQVEFDPATGLIRDYDGNGTRDKIWAMGRMRHENITIRPDRITAYQAEDGGTSCVYKFVANQAENLSAGTLYVLRRDPNNQTIGQWIQVPNTTQANRNNTANVAASLGGTDWDNVEEVEVGPDGKVYFASKGSGIIWRFKDDGLTVSELVAWVPSRFYPITYNGGVQNEDWGEGIDNLAFDGDGNLWALQDGDRNNLWVVRPDHTPMNPKVELFMTTPNGSEPTGLTFSPDFRYGFMSLQSPSSSNTQTIMDAAGNLIRFNANVTIVFANKKYLGPQDPPKLAQINPEPSIDAFPNPFSTSTNIKVNLTEKTQVKLEVYNMYTAVGQTKTLYEGELESGIQYFEFNPTENAGQQTGMYLVRLQVNGKQFVTKILQLRE